MKNFSQHLAEASKETKLISAFPGTGKSHFFREAKDGDKVVLDSDSSEFDKSEFPENYIKHIKDNMGFADIIFISSHEDVRNALVENKLAFTLVYPDKSLKDSYIERYKERGSPKAFIELIEKNWDDWIDQLEAQTNCEKIKLNSGQYISDVIDQ